MGNIDGVRSAVDSDWSKGKDARGAGVVLTCVQAKEAPCLVEGGNRASVSK